MRTYLDCYPCFLRQALDAARRAGADDTQQRVVLDRVLEVLRQVELAASPPEIGDRVHRTVRQVTGNGDPYRGAKAVSTRQALTLYPRLMALVRAADDPLRVAVRMSIAGNIIDAARSQECDLWRTVERVLAQLFAIDDGPAFREALAGAGQVLFLADNAGETVFDRVLIEALNVPVVYAVKGGPVLNDATREDALAAGVDRVAEIVSTGSDAPGTILDRCSDDFRWLYEQAELIIAKGQANYETLSAEGPRVFCLLQTKCPVIARDVGVPVGSIVLRQGRVTAACTGRDALSGAGEEKSTEAFLDVLRGCSRGSPSPRICAGGSWGPVRWRSSIHPARAVHCRFRPPAELFPSRAGARPDQPLLRTSGRKTADRAQMRP